MKKELRARAIQMRVQKRASYSEIRSALNVSKSTLSYWLREYPLTEREILALRQHGWAKGEASRERYRNTMRKKKEEKIATLYKAECKRFSRPSDQELRVAGLMLYLAEGGKNRSGQVVLANTNPKVVKFFILWLHRFFEIPKKGVRVQLHLYEGMDIAKEHKFWENALGLKKEQFYKTSIRKATKNSFSYKESYRHGTCSAYAFGEEMRLKIQVALDVFMDKGLKKMRV